MTLDPGKFQGIVAWCSQALDVPGGMQELIDQLLARPWLADVECQEGSLAVRSDGDGAYVGLRTQEVGTKEEPDCLCFKGGVFIK